jgi:hypothetical protein
MDINVAINRLGSGLGALAGRLGALEKRMQRAESFDGDGSWMWLGPYQALSPFAATANTHIGTAPRAATILKFVCSVFISTTNNGTNYWTIALQGSASGTYASFDTKLMAANTWIKTTVTVFSPSTITASDVYLTVLATKTLTPGNLFIATPGVYFV